MTVNRKIVTFLTLVIAVFALSTFVSAQESKSDAPPVKERRLDKLNKGMDRKRGENGMKGKHGMHGRGGGKHIMRSLRAIDLTETQKTQIKSLMETNWASFQSTNEELKGLMMKRREGTLTSDDQTRLEQFKNERKAAAEQMKITIMGLLTPEQTAKLDQMKAEREQRMQERKQRWQERKLQKEAQKENK